MYPTQIVSGTDLHPFSPSIPRNNVSGPIRRSSQIQQNRHERWSGSYLPDTRHQCACAPKEIEDMRLTALVIAVFLTASAAEAVDRKNLPGRDVTICMPQINDSRVREATRIATRIFDDIGVRLEWKLPAECPVAEDAIRVSFSRGNPNQPA